MRDFILRARKGPSTSEFSLDALPKMCHLEIVAHCVANAVFYSLNLRSSVRIHIVLDGPSDPPKIVRIESDRLGSLDGFDEKALTGVLREALKAGEGLLLHQERESRRGVFVAKRSFESLVRQQAAIGPMFVLQKRARDIRELEFSNTSTFVFSDHLSMPKKTDKFLLRLGAVSISVGPKMLFASQCITLVHNELDRLDLP